MGGYTNLTGLTDMVLIKYDPAGNQVWVRTHNGADDKSDSIARIGVDSQGNIVATGYIQPASFYSDFGTLKYDPDGNQLWIRLYDGPITNDEEIPRALAIGSDDSIYVTEYQEGMVRVATVKYDANGVQQWAMTYDNPGTLTDVGWGIAVDAAGNVVVNGQSPILTIRYSDSGSPGPTPTQTATRTVTPTPAVTPTPTVTPTSGGCVSNCLRSTQIRLQSTTSGVRGQVTVRDQAGVAIGSATVSVTWTLPGDGTQSQTANTNSQGRANFSVTGGSGTYTLTVTDIAKAGYTFDPANSVLSQSLTK